ncbi:MAG: hypothetical protein LBC83_03830 [Oscillospiraceae bacterium]|nr:hypothetical protein [Oscillospiraceae bacterium]
MKTEKVGNGIITAPRPTYVKHRDGARRPSVRFSTLFAVILCSPLSPFFSACAAFHCANSRLPSSLSKNRCISGNKHKSERLADKSVATPCIVILRRSSGTLTHDTFGGVAVKVSEWVRYSLEYLKKPFHATIIAHISNIFQALFAKPHKTPQDNPCGVSACRLRQFYYNPKTLPYKQGVRII